MLLLQVVDHYRKMVRKSNQFKAETEEEKPQKKPGKVRSGFFSDLWGNPNLKRVVGFSLVLFSLYLIIAFTSYFVTWFSGSNDDIFSGISGSRILADSSVQAHNWGGRFGASLANKFIKDWVGIAAYLIAFLLTLFGIRQLAGFSPLPLGKTFRITTVVILWLPALLGLLYGSDDFRIDRIIEKPKPFRLNDEV